MIEKNGLINRWMERQSDRCLRRNKLAKARR